MSHCTCDMLLCNCHQCVLSKGTFYFHFWYNMGVAPQLVLETGKTTGNSDTYNMGGTKDSFFSSSKQPIK